MLPLLLFRWILDDLDFISTDSAQSMMCAFGRIHNDRKVVFCFMHATPSNQHDTDLLACIEHTRRMTPATSVNACCVYFVGSVCKM